MYRLFVAIDLPDVIKKEVQAICRDLPGARLVEGGQLHLTLRFIGDADEQLFQGIRDHLGRVKWESFGIELRGVGHFPPGKRARVLWVGVDAPDALHSLQRDVEQALVLAGVPPEGRGFSPHITLARFREPLPGLTAPFEERYREFATGRFAVDAFHLYSSTLTGAGAIHRREATYTVPAGR
jgi:RNA 2',3'-cyclic 3'-phosphodiesterase